MTNEELKKLEEYRICFSNKSNRSLTQAEQARKYDLQSVWDNYEKSRVEFIRKYREYTEDQALDFKTQFENLKKRRNLNNNAIAKYLGISTTMLSSYCHDTPPSIGIAIGICLALELDVQQACTLLNSLGVSLICSNKAHSAYLYLINNQYYASKKSREECNNLLEYFGIDKRYHIEKRSSGRKKKNIE